MRPLLRTFLMIASALLLASTAVLADERDAIFGESAGGGSPNAAADTSEDAWDDEFWDQWQSGSGSTSSGSSQEGLQEENAAQNERDEIFQSILREQEARKRGKFRTLTPLGSLFQRQIPELPELRWTETVSDAPESSSRTLRYVASGAFFITAVGIAIYLMTHRESEPDKSKEKAE